MKFLTSNILVLGIGTAVIITFSLLFYFDLTKKVEAGEVEQVGIITYKEKIAQRKYSSQVVWEEIEQNAPVYNNDTIRTADLSNADIKLKDGTEIIIDQNSMILLSFSKNKIEIAFSHGSLSTKRNDLKGSDLKKLNIMSAASGTTIAVEKSDLKLSQEKGKDLNITVNKGNVKVSAGDEEKVVSVNQKLVITKDAKKMEVYELTLKLTSPSSNSYFITTRKKEKINLTWEPVKGKVDIFLEVSKNISFKNPVVKNKVKGSAKIVNLPDGIYYWRLRAINKASKKIDYSDSWKFKVISEKPVNLITPKYGEIFSYRTTMPIIHFRWSKSKIASKYKLLIASDTGMKKIIHSLNAPENHLAFDKLGKGVYYIKVSTETNLGKKSTISTSKISKIVINKKKTIDPPGLIFPPDNKSISKIYFKGNGITFTWERSNDIHLARLLVAKDNKFKNIILDSKSRTNYLKFQKDLPERKYYWRIIGILKDGHEIQPSPYRSFTVAKSEPILLVSPENNSIVMPNENRKPEVRFSWKKVAIPGKYKLQISKNNKFSPVYKMFEVQAFYKVVKDLGEGKYFWKVSLLDKDGKKLISSVARSVAVKDMLQIPEIISPRNGFVINMQNRDVLSLLWKKHKMADLYYVKLYQALGNQGRFIAEQKSKKTNFNFYELHKLDIGRFFWTLQAFETDNKNNILRKSPLVKSYFNITLGKPIKKPEITSLKIREID